MKNKKFYFKNLKIRMKPANTRNLIKSKRKQTKEQQLTNTLINSGKLVYKKIKKRKKTKMRKKKVYKKLTTKYIN